MNRNLLADWENWVIFLGILVLWPKYILGWEGPVWELSPYVILVLLVVVLYRRVSRIRNASVDQTKPPIL